VVLPRLGPLAAATPLSERLEAAFRFAGAADASKVKPLLLAGPPGSGKTLAAAKLAARAVIAGIAVRLISADAGSAGAVEQLVAFTRPLGITVETAEGPVGLATLFTSKPAAPETLVIIDSQGVNPFERSELAALGAQIVTVRAEPILVLSAGGDPRESAEMAEAFARVGCTRLLATRLDIARRLGGLLAAANAGLAFTEVGASPLMAKGLQPLTPEILARRLLSERTDGAGVR
jgi:flagellar biosynthesis protein FlhF